jgi:hypothetical protein
MMDYYDAATALRKTRRIAFLRGQQLAMFPRTREAAVSLARRALSLLPLRVRHGLVVESAIAESTEEMIHVAAMSLGAAVVVATRLPVIERALVTQQFFQFGRELMATYGDDAEVATRH